MITNFLQFVESVAHFFEKDEAVKAEKLANIKKEVLPFFLDKFESIAEENNGHLAAGKVIHQQKKKILRTIN